MRTLNYPSRRLTNGYRSFVRHRWNFIVTFNLFDRRHSNSDHAAAAQLYCGNLPHYHWLGWRVSPVRTLIANGTHFAEGGMDRSDDGCRAWAPEMFFEVPQTLVTSRASDGNRGDKRSDLSSGPPGVASVPSRKYAGYKGVPAPVVSMALTGRAGMNSCPSPTTSIRAPREPSVTATNFRTPASTRAVAASAALLLPVMALQLPRYPRPRSYLSALNFFVEICFSSVQLD
jgi:hypothetical protein